MAEFENIAVAATKLVVAGTLPAGRKWGVGDVLSVLAYSWLRGVSVAHAAEKLNSWAIRHGIHAPAEFADGRHSRAFPHQTTVSAWLRALDLETAHELARAVFDAALLLGRERGLVPRQLVLQYDLTYRAYWGKRRDPLTEGSKVVKGTRFIRHYHAAMVHGFRPHAFTGSGTPHFSRSNPVRGTGKVLRRITTSIPRQSISPSRLPSNQMLRNQQLKFYL
ncbi:MAG: hypothetical protein ACTSU5_01025 [Promethearchaeota archaeon]